VTSALSLEKDSSVMLRKLLLGLVVVASLTGCSGNPGQRNDPVKVEGKVVLEDGTPIQDVWLVLQPTDHGSMATVPVSPKGTFSGNFVPGKYAYHFQVMPSNSAAYKQVPEKYRSAHLDRQVSIKEGEVEIKLDKS
jgi:hypothetical protein